MTKHEERDRIQAAFAPGWMQRISDEIRKESIHWPSHRRDYDERPPFSQPMPQHSQDARQIAVG